MGSISIIGNVEKKDPISNVLWKLQYFMIIIRTCKSVLRAPDLPSVLLLLSPMAATSMAGARTLATPCYCRKSPGGEVWVVWGDLTLCQCALCDDGRICPVFPFCSCLLVSSSCNAMNEIDMRALLFDFPFNSKCFSFVRPLHCKYILCSFLKAWHNSYSALFVTWLD